MNEIQRYLRHILPGVVFLVETIIIILIMLPDWTVNMLERITTNGSVVTLFALLIASGGLGYIFGVINYLLMWKYKSPAFDYRDLVEALRKRNIIKIINVKTEKAVNRKLDIETAWIVVTSLENEFLKLSKRLKGAESRNNSLADLSHAAGASKIASIAAWLTAIVIMVYLVISHFFTIHHCFCFSFNNFLNLHVILYSLLFVFANLIAFGLFWIHHKNSERMSRLARDFSEEVLIDSLLYDVKTHKPIETNVIIRKNTN